jgi:hypothetical protein
MKTLASQPGQVTIFNGLSFVLIASWLPSQAGFIANQYP